MYVCREINYLDCKKYTIGKKLSTETNMNMKVKSRKKKKQINQKETMEVALSIFTIIIKQSLY